MTKKELENYEPKGKLTGFPKEVIARMLECQAEQGTKRDVTVFEKYNSCSLGAGGFDWNLSKEGGCFWFEVITKENFDLFFEKYPKKEDNQEFRVGDKVYDILLKEVGIVQDIVYSSSIPYGLSVEFKSGVKSYTINGCYIPEYKNPHVLHYRDDYKYDIIDFNNLPQRQESKKWRAEKGGRYYYIRLECKVEYYVEKNDSLDEDYYDSKNYFQTKEQAQEVADELKEYFNQLINK